MNYTGVTGKFEQKDARIVFLELGVLGLFFEELNRRIFVFNFLVEKILLKIFQ